MTASRHNGCWYFLVLLLTTPAAAGPVDVAGIAEKERELRGLQSRIGEIENKLGSSEQHRRSLTDQLRTTEQQIAHSTRKLRDLKQSLERQHKRLAVLQDSRREQQQGLETQREGLARQLRAAYATGRQEKLKILLNQEDMALISRVMVYYDYFNRARTEQISRITEVLETLRITEQKIAQENERLSHLLLQEQDEQGRLERKNQARLEVIAALDHEIQGKGDELQRLKQDEQKLQSLVKHLQEEQLITLPLGKAGEIPFQQMKGALKWPARGRLTSHYGARKKVGLMWDGVIISAPEGREVKAVHHGRVAFADWLRGFGLLLIIDHGDGYMTLYGHNQSLFKELGEWVEPGETIALVGRSGGKNRAGVYFGIRYNGRPVNPKAWCRKPKGNKVG